MCQLSSLFLSVELCVALILVLDDVYSESLACFAAHPILIVLVAGRHVQTVHYVCHGV